MFQDILQNVNVNVATAFVFVLVFLLVHYITKTPSKIPPYSTPALPVFGNLHLLANQDVLEVFKALRNKHGDIFSIYMGSQLMVVINGYSVIREALVRNGRTFSERPINFLSQVLNKDSGILFTSGQKLKEQRRFAMNALQEFGFGRSSFEHNITEEVNELLSIIDKQNGKPFQTKGLINLCVANVMFQILLGKRCKHTDPVFLEFLDIVDTSSPLMTNASVLVNCFPFLQYIPGDPLKMNFLKENSKRFEKLCGSVIQEHKDTYQEGVARDLIDLYITEARRRQKSGEPSTFTDIQLIVTVGDLFGAGSETTSTTIIWALLHFLHFPESQRKCSEELERVVGRNRPSKTKNICHIWKPRYWK